MNVPQPGDQAPDFTLPTTEGDVSLAGLLAKDRLILAFYAEDATPLCSTEISMLKGDYALVREFAATVLAVSADSIDSHRAFAERLGGVPFPLASDPGLAVARLYGVADEDEKRCRRAVFVIDETAMVLHSQPWFQPGNPPQYQAIFEALGLET